MARDKKQIKCEIHSHIGDVTHSTPYAIDLILPNGAKLEILLENYDDDCFRISCRTEHEFAILPECSNVATIRAAIKPRK